MFTATGGGVGALLTLLAACSDGDAPGDRTLVDAAPPPPPGPCVVKWTEKPFCEAGAPAKAGIVSDAATGADAGSDGSVDGPGDAAVPDAATVEPTVPDVSSNECLTVRDLTLECPSYVTDIDVGPGSAGATELLVSQAGLAHYASPTDYSLVPDRRAHLQRVKIAEDGRSTVTLDPIPPFERKQRGFVPGGAIGLLPGTDTREAALVFVTPTEDAQSELRAGAFDASGAITLGSSLRIPAGISSRPAVFGAPSGEGFLLAEPRGGEFNAPTAGANFVLVRGLPDAPRVVPTMAKSGAYAFAITTDPTGTPAGLFKEGNVLRLREGETLERERWSSPLENGANIPLFDLTYVVENGTATPATLVRQGDNDATLIRFIHQDIETRGARLGASYSTCSRNSYLGVTCDACPVHESCEVGEDTIGPARLFTRDGRLFAIFISTDVRRRMGYARSVLPIVNAGCACTLEERAREAFADSLVVVELVPKANKGDVPDVVEHMRIPMFKARTTRFSTFVPRPDGDVDVVVGAQLDDYEIPHTAPPPQPTLFRVLRISTPTR